MFAVLTLDNVATVCCVDSRQRCLLPITTCPFECVLQLDRKLLLTDLKVMLAGACGWEGTSLCWALRRAVARIDHRAPSRKVCQV